MTYLLLLNFQYCESGKKTIDQTNLNLDLKNYALIMRYFKTHDQIFDHKPSITKIDTHFEITSMEILLTRFEKYIPKN